MFKKLHLLAKPERLYHWCGYWQTPTSIVAILLLLLAWGWGFAVAPPDYQQGDSYRIIYLHVPAAMASLAVYASMALAAFCATVWQIKQANLLAAAMAPIGAVFTFIALVTGSCWGKPMWGTWWIWDARLTSELILLFLYMGIIALMQAFEDRQLAGRAAAILILVGVINLPIIHFSVQWWNTLHQGSSGLLQQSIAAPMRRPLQIAILANFLLFVALMLYRLRTLILASEQRRPWAIEHALLKGIK
jgi:heme exporter protein C